MVGRDPRVPQQLRLVARDPAHGVPAAAAVPGRTSAVAPLATSPLADRRALVRARDQSAPRATDVDGFGRRDRAEPALRGRGRPSPEPGSGDRDRLPGALGRRGRVADPSVPPVDRCGAIADQVGGVRTRGLAGRDPRQQLLDPGKPRDRGGRRRGVPDVPRLGRRRRSAIPPLRPRRRRPEGPDLRCLRSVRDVDLPRGRGGRRCLARAG